MNSLSAAMVVFGLNFASTCRDVCTVFTLITNYIGRGSSSMVCLN